MVRVGIVGTGFVASRRADVFQADPRTQVVATAGRTWEKVAQLAATCGAKPYAAWQDLVTADLDLVVVAHASQFHGEVVEAALQAGKHVVVEYPLAVDLTQARRLVHLARQQNRLLHVEHIELISPIHLAIRQAFPSLGRPFHAHNRTCVPQRPAPRKWTYHRHQFGFPFVGALARLNRLIDLLGLVRSVYGEWQVAGEDPEGYYTSCHCRALLTFADGPTATLVYAKGEQIWQSERRFKILGEQGAIVIDGERGELIQPDSSGKGTQSTPLDLGDMKGLFARETTWVIDHLIDGRPLYTSPEASLYALQVAKAIETSSLTGQSVSLWEPTPAESG